MASVLFHLRRNRKVPFLFHRILHGGENFVSIAVPSLKSSGLLKAK